jgi:hypothetical protein
MKYRTFSYTGFIHSIQHILTLAMKQDRARQANNSHALLPRFQVMPIIEAMVVTAVNFRQIRNRRRDQHLKGWQLMHQGGSSLARGPPSKPAYNDFATELTINKESIMLLLLFLLQRKCS